MSSMRRADIKTAGASARPQPDRPNDAPGLAARIMAAVAVITSGSVTANFRRNRAVSSAYAMSERNPIPTKNMMPATMLPTVMASVTDRSSFHPTGTSCTRDSISISVFISDLQNAAPRDLDDAKRRFSEAGCLTLLFQAESVTCLSRSPVSADFREDFNYPYVGENHSRLLEIAPSILHYRSNGLKMRSVDL